MQWWTPLRSKRPGAFTRHSFRAESASDRCSTPRWRLGLGSVVRHCARSGRPPQERSLSAGAV